MVALGRLMVAAAARPGHRNFDGFGEKGVPQWRQVIDEHGVLQQPVAVCQALPVRRQRIEFGATTRTCSATCVGEDLQARIS